MKREAVEIDIPADLASKNLDEQILDPARFERTCDIKTEKYETHQLFPSKRLKLSKCIINNEQTNENLNTNQGDVATATFSQSLSSMNHLSAVTPTKSCFIERIVFTGFKVNSEITINSLLQSNFICVPDKSKRDAIRNAILLALGQVLATPSDFIKENEDKATVNLELNRHGSQVKLRQEILRSALGFSHKEAKKLIGPVSFISEDDCKDIKDAKQNYAFFLRVNGLNSAQHLKFEEDVLSNSSLEMLQERIDHVLFNLGGNYWQKIDIDQDLRRVQARKTQVADMTRQVETCIEQKSYLIVRLQEGLNDLRHKCTPSLADHFKKNEILVENELNRLHSEVAELIEQLGKLKTESIELFKQRQSLLESKLATDRVVFELENELDLLMNEQTAVQTEIERQKSSADRFRWLMSKLKLVGSLKFDKKKSELKIIVDGKDKLSNGQRSAIRVAFLLAVGSTTGTNVLVSDELMGKERHREVFKVIRKIAHKESDTQFIYMSAKRLNDLLWEDHVKLYVLF